MAMHLSSFELPLLPKALSKPFARLSGKTKRAMAVTLPSFRPSKDRTTSQSRFVRALTNPNEIIAELLPQPKQRDSSTSRLENSKFARAIGGTGFDYGIGGSPSDHAKALPPCEEPLADIAIDAEIESRLPQGHSVRSLRREDFDNGYTHLRHVGVISRERWEERCEYLRSRSDTYVVCVITNTENYVVCSGTLVVERKFTHDMCLVGHVEDLLVGEGQSGKNLGGRMLEALDHIAKNLGCYKTMVGTTETNETFHGEHDFKRGGIEMNHHHFVPKKTMPPKASDRDPSPAYSHHDSLSDLCKEPVVDVAHAPAYSLEDEKAVEQVTATVTETSAVDGGALKCS